MTKNQLLVVGSVNYDLIFRHERIPGPGEGVTRAELVRSCGGKGANQAVVAARCASCPELSSIRVVFAGAIGDDDFGAEQRSVLVEDRVDTSYLKEVPGNFTGTSSIWVETGSGQNRILNASGANLDFLPEDADGLPYGQAGIVLVQNEIPARSIERVVDRAAENGVPVVWNPAPMAGADVPNLDPSKVAWVTPNESEAAELLGNEETADPARTAAKLRERGYGGIVLTLGEKGVWLACNDFQGHLPAPRVQAVDTTGAGDAFNGAFAIALVAGYGPRTAAQFGVAYASESVLHRGTQTGFPKKVPERIQNLLSSSV